MNGQQLAGTTERRRRLLQMVEGRECRPQLSELGAALGVSKSVIWNDLQALRFAGAAIPRPERYVRGRTRIVRLKPGEPIPAGVPARSLKSNGYVELMWPAVGGKAVRAYEHRVVMGNPIGVVHHINHDRADNRRENLRAYPTARQHMRDSHNDFDFQRAIDLYRSGLSTAQVAKAVGSWPGNVYRYLRECGVPLRSQSEAQRHPVDHAAVARLHHDGLSIRKIAVACGSTQDIVRRAMRDIGLLPHPHHCRPRKAA